MYRPITIIVAAILLTAWVAIAVRSATVIPGRRAIPATQSALRSAELFDVPVDELNVVVSDEKENLCVQPFVNFQVPTGTILPFVGPILPAGFLWCDGSDIPAMHSALKIVVGRKYSANGQTFAVPDMRGRVLKGAPSTTSVKDVASMYGGSNTSIATLGVHNHRIRVRCDKDTCTTSEKGTTFNTVPVKAYARKLSNLPHGRTFRGVRIHTDASASRNMVVMKSTTGQTGEGQPHNNIQPTKIVNYIIKY